MNLLHSSARWNLAKAGVLLTLLLLRCTGSWAQDASTGEALFEANCAACHNFKQDGIGPQLGGLSEAVEPNYLAEFIKSPKAMIDARVSRAVDKYKKFKTIMPDFNHLGAKQIDKLVAYIRQQPAPKGSMSERLGIENPITPAIAKSAIPLGLQRVTQFPVTNKTQPYSRVNKMGFHPISKEIMVADLQGKLFILNTNDQPDVYFDASQHFTYFINTPGLAAGLGSFAFHPDFAKNRLFYTTHSEANHNVKADFAYADSIPVRYQWVITEWTLDSPTARILTGKPREVLRVNVVGQIHGMQEIAFNSYAKPTDADYGLLYIGIGDGGAVEMGYPFIPKNKNHVWGKVLRIDPTGNNSQNGQYGIPKSNPYVGKDGLDEVYAEGFRNPNRMSWTKDGKMLVSNIGQRNLESLYLVEPGKNYGWPDREGTFLIDSTATVNNIYPLPKNDAQYGFSYPVAQFDHDEGNAIMGGFEYTGTKLPQLRGKYIFGEIVRGRVFYINLNEVKEGKQATIHEFPLIMNGKDVTLKELSKADKVDLRIGQDAYGELYLMTKADGVMYKIIKF